MGEICNVERVILQAIKNLSCETSAERIVSEVERIRIKSMSLALVYSALHGMEKNGLVLSRSEESGKLYFSLTDLGKEETK